MQIGRTTIARSRGIAGLAVRAAIVGGCAMFVCACNTDQQVVAGVPDVPYDYRQRHPITMTETNHTLQIFVGTSRGELNAAQRAEVAQFAHSWHRDINRRRRHRAAGWRDQRAGGRQLRTHDPLDLGGRQRSAERHRGPHLSGARTQHRADPRQLSEDRRPSRPVRPLADKISARVTTATISKISRCGTMAARHSATLPPWSIILPTSCNRAARRRLTTMRRTTVMEKYRAGSSPATTYPTLEGKISDIAR